MPELQGRFSDPRGARSDLTKDDFIRISDRTQNSLTKQYTALLSTEGVEAGIHRQMPPKRWPGICLPRKSNHAKHRRPTVIYHYWSGCWKTLSFEAPDMAAAK